MKLIKGDSLEVLSRATDNSVDAIVTDPPYGLSFMGKHWDYDVPSVELWKEAMRVLKPGGHLLSFAGSRTYHRMAVNIEDAGFEIRDQIMWVYGSGFPKSHNIGKAVDKLQGNEREVTGQSRNGSNSLMGGLSDTTTTTIQDITKGNSPWEGWGTALKPAHEPIVMARKPLSEKTIVDNVLEHGTGGINIDGCRVETTDKMRETKHPAGTAMAPGGGNRKNGETLIKPHAQGRFPANFIHDGSDEVVGLFPDTNRIDKRTSSSGSGKEMGIYGAYEGGEFSRPQDYGGNASRFFYCAKASKAERNKGLEGFEEKEVGRGTTRRCGNCQKPIVGLSQTDKCICDNRIEVSTHKKNHHPTVKPVALMRYLVRLVTPKDGTVLDPFMGSGTTGIACKDEGFDFIGIEREEEYIEIAKARIGVV